MASHGSEPTHPSSLPLVVQVAFAGARQLGDDTLDDSARAAFEAAVAQQLQSALADLPRRLGLGDMHFLVGISQMAAGADLLFSESAARLGWGQRVFLPQQREAYLAAVGSAGPDFNPAESERATCILNSTHVIEESVVTSAPTRADRFCETNAAILAEADALVCLRVADRSGKVGGTQAMRDRAKALEKAVLELVLQVASDGTPTLQATFHGVRDSQDQPRMLAPSLPDTAPRVVPAIKLAAPIRPAYWPAMFDYVEALKTASSAGSQQRQTFFRIAACTVVGTHVVATLLALLAMTSLVAGGPGCLLKWVLAAEVGLLLLGYLTHRSLHHGRHAEQWAMARLCSEVARSVRAYGRLPGTLRYLLALPMPDSLKPLLRTLVVLHLRAVRGAVGEDYRQELERYRDERLKNPDPRRGQIAYYAGKQSEAKWHARWARRAFKTMSVMAMLAAGAKLVFKLGGVPVAGGLGDGLAIAAVLLPVVAVGVLSYTSALDIEARWHTFAQMHSFAERQALYMVGVSSPGEAASIAADTESRLLGETVTWYSRRAYTSIA
jgi:hypothetical protein